MTNSPEAVRAAFRSREGVEATRMFGSDGLKIGGKVFAMVVKGALVVKLDKTRAAALVGSGDASVFDPGHGRPMAQWISVKQDSGAKWCDLAAEAADYVDAAARKR